MLYDAIWTVRLDAVVAVLEVQLGPGADEAVRVAPVDVVRVGHHRRRAQLRARNRRRRCIASSRRRRRAPRHPHRRAEVTRHLELPLGAGSVATTGGGSAGDATRPPTCGVLGRQPGRTRRARLLLLGRRRGRCGAAAAAHDRRRRGAGGGEAGGDAVAGAARAAASARDQRDDSGRSTNKLETIKERLKVDASILRPSRGG